VGENHLVIKAVRKDCSLTRYRIRVLKDTCLYDDAEHFMVKHGDNITLLVDKLLDNEFLLARYTDPAYPW